MKRLTLLRPEERVVPVLDVFCADEALHLFHFAFMGKDDHHGGIALVGQQENSGVVLIIPEEVVASRLPHHVHLNSGVFVHMEILLACEIAIERLQPLSCNETNDVYTDGGYLFENVAVCSLNVLVSKTSFKPVIHMLCA